VIYLCNHIKMKIRQNRQRRSRACSALPCRAALLAANPAPGQHANALPTGRTHSARHRTTSADHRLKTSALPRPGARAPPRHAGSALPAARPVKVPAGVRRGPASGPLKTNPARRWVYSSRPSRLTKFRGAQPSSRLCCVSANVRLVTHHAGRQLELGTAKDEPFELLGRCLGDLGRETSLVWVTNYTRLSYFSFGPRVGHRGAEGRQPYQQGCVKA